ncbi:hypothetical protein LINPERHAP1_LOCUS27223 [Linum perenne]
MRVDYHDYLVKLVDEESSPTEWPPLPRVIRIGRGDDDFDKNNWWYLKMTHPDGGLTMLAFYEGNRSQISLNDHYGHGDIMIPLPFSKDLEAKLKLGLIPHQDEVTDHQEQDNLNTKVSLSCAAGYAAVSGVVFLGTVLCLSSAVAISTSVTGSISFFILTNLRNDQISISLLFKTAAAVYSKIEKTATGKSIQPSFSPTKF